MEDYVDKHIIGYVMRSDPLYEMNYFMRDNHWGRHVHEHFFLQFLLVTSGSLTIRISEDTYLLTPGYASLIPPHVPHEIYSTTGYEQVGVNVILDHDEEMNGLIGLLREYVTKPFILELVGAVTTAEEYTRLLSSSDRIAEAKAALIAYSALLEAVECLQNDQQKVFSEQLSLYINDHLADGIRVEDVAKSFHMSVSHLERMAKKTFGCGVMSVYNKKRLTRAGILLRNSHLAISEVAQKVGFSDPANFSNFFSARMGMSPSQFRQLHQ